MVENLDYEYARIDFDPKGGRQAVKNVSLFTDTNKRHFLKCSKTLQNNWLLGSGYFYYLSYSFVQVDIKDCIKPLDDLVFVFDSQYLKSEPCEDLFDGKQLLRYSSARHFLVRLKLMGNVTGRICTLRGSHHKRQSSSMVAFTRASFHPQALSFCIIHKRQCLKEFTVFIFLRSLTQW